MVASAGQAHVAPGVVLGDGALVHESAYVDAGAVIGAGTRIWHFSHVMGGAHIGARCSLGQNVVVMNSVVIGDNAKIQNNVSLYEGVELEADVFCGPSMVFTNVYNPRSAVSRKNEYRRTLVRRGASIGANATIVCGVTIGRFAFIGAGAVVNRDVPDYALMAGVPARRMGWMSEDGYKLESLSLAGAEGEVEVLRCPGTDVRYDRRGELVTRIDPET
jgi:UDP-2-acetamido-3-amino-2,3-dideoxy-glucuronate N-acetyltransferase